MTTKKIEHQSIKVQLLGQIELASERGTAHEFVSLGACAPSQQQFHRQAACCCFQTCCS
jgi:hypothetical protein